MQAPIQRARIGAEVGRQLEQHRAEPVAKPGRRAQQALDRLGRIAQPPYMREVTAPPDPQHETPRGPGAPTRERLPGLPPVELSLVLYPGLTAPRLTPPPP